MVTLATTVALACQPVMLVHAAPAASQEQSARAEAQLSAEDIAVLSKLFDADFFAKKYPQVANAVGNNADAMFAYFCKWGVYEGKQCCAGFDVAAYAVAYGDLAAAFGTDIMKYYKHYVENGITEGRVLTTVDACKTVGIDAKLIESQRFTVNEAGQPEFVNFYDATSKSFIYNEAQAKATPAGTYSDYAVAKQNTPATTPVVSSESKEDTPTYEAKHEEAKPGFNQKKYAADMDDWYNSQPNVMNYLTESGKATYAKSLENWQASEPKAENFSMGYMYDTEEEAQQAYTVAISLWKENTPDPTGYMTEDEKHQYAGALARWIADEPEIDDYIVNTYESQQAADEAWAIDHAAAEPTVEKLMNQWLSEHPEPSIEDISAHDAWMRDKEDRQTEVEGTMGALHLEWEHETKPDSYTYYEGGYESEQAKQAAFDRDTADWEEAEPKKENFASSEEYQRAVEEWQAAKPKEEYYLSPEELDLGDGVRVYINKICDYEGTPIDVQVIDYYEIEEGGFTGDFIKSEYLYDDRNGQTKEEAVENASELWADEHPWPTTEDFQGGEVNGEKFFADSDDWCEREPDRETYENGGNGNYVGCPEYGPVPVNPTPAPTTIPAE